MRVIYEGGPGEAGIIFKTPGHCDAAIKPDQPGLDRRRRPGELSIPARYASIQRVPTGIRAVSDPQLVGHRLAMELFENPRGVPWGVGRYPCRVEHDDGSHSQARDELDPHRRSG